MVASSSCERLCSSCERSTSSPLTEREPRLCTNTRGAGPNTASGLVGSQMGEVEARAGGGCDGSQEGRLVQLCVRLAGADAAAVLCATQSSRWLRVRPRTSRTACEREQVCKRLQYEAARGGDNRFDIRT
eukprot:6173356-Pleurochrysis_carterae.AAC.1